MTLAPLTTANSSLVSVIFDISKQKSLAHCYHMLVFRESSVSFKVLTSKNYKKRSCCIAIRMEVMFPKPVLNTETNQSIINSSEIFKMFYRKKLFSYKIITLSSASLKINSVNQTEFTR
jgi:hypothetical protein